MSVVDSAWVVSAAGEICILNLEANGAVGGACSPVEAALKSGVGLTVITSQHRKGQRLRRSIVGIAPHDAITAIAHRRHEEVRMNVKDGVFQYQDDVANPPDFYSLVTSG